MDDEDDALKEGNTVAGATGDEALTVGELRAELVRLRARVLSLEVALAEERRAFVLFRAAQPNPTLYELSEKARQDLARDIWALGRRMSFGHRLLVWLRRKLNISKD
jgi:hypothetical protein